MFCYANFIFYKTINECIKDLFQWNDHHDFGHHRPDLVKVVLINGKSNLFKVYGISSLFIYLCFPLSLEETKDLN